MRGLVLKKLKGGKLGRTNELIYVKARIGLRCEQRARSRKYMNIHTSGDSRWKLRKVCSVDHNFIIKLDNDVHDLLCRSKETKKHIKDKGRMRTLN